jgi:quercetin dioxygenase-like cupin family protein
MKASNGMRWAGCAIGAMILSVSASGQYKQAVPTGFMRLDADEIHAGAIFGDPGKPGMYVTRNRFMPGQGSRPHYHDQDRYITVIKGTWWVSLGSEADVYNPDKMVPVKQGSFIFEPAFGHHYDQAKDEEVIVQIMGPGPVKSFQLENKGAAASGQK